MVRSWSQKKVNSQDVRGESAHDRTILAAFIDKLNVDDELVDPDTQESLGAKEIQAGCIKVIEIRPKYIIAQIIEGEASHIVAGAMCRLREGSSENKPSKPKTSGSNSKPVSWQSP